MDDTKEDIVRHEQAVPDLSRDAEANLKKRHVNTQLDDAAALLEEAGAVTFTAAESKKVLRKIDLWVCLPMCIIYTMQNMDKQSISYAAVFNLQAETGLVGTQYSWLTRYVDRGSAESADSQWGLPDSADLSTAVVVRARGVPRQVLGALQLCGMEYLHHLSWYVMLCWSC